MENEDPFNLCGSTIDGKYRVLSVVGQGGFGVVYKGVHAGFEAPVAVKCLKLPPHFDLAAQEALVRQLREEGRLLMRLSQRTPGIVQAMDVGSFTTPNGARVPYLILEWLEGRTLAAEMHARKGMPLREAFALLDPAARALAVAHEEKIAHRDIKPENIFCVTSGGRATLKILDFGIAKLLGDAASPTSGTAIGGPSMFTPNYGAPEQFDKKRGASGPWTDVFAFALVFVEVVSGRPALEGEGLFPLYAASSDPDKRPTLRARGVAAPEGVERVLEKALNPEPVQRYPNLGSFWSALEAAMAEAGAIALPPHSFTGRPGGDATFDFEGAKTVQVGGPQGTTAKTTNAPTERSAGTPPKRGYGGWIAFGVLLAAVAGGGVAVKEGVLRFGRRSSATHASASATAAVVEPEVSHNKAAAAAFREAMQAWHDGSQERAIRGMEGAEKLDPELGAAQIRLAIWHMMAGSAAGKQAEGREHYQEAVLHRGKLGERDKGLVEAAQPYMSQPWDLDEWNKRIEALSAKYPDDTELLVYVGASHMARLQPDPAIAAFEKALAKDSGLIAARVLEGDSLAMKGDVAGQLRAYKACLDSSPLATQCLVRQLSLRALGGDCNAMKADAQRLQSIDPSSPGTYRQLAQALLATGSPSDSVLEAFGRAWALEQEGDRKVAELQDRAALAAAAGDFVNAEKRLEEWQAAVADRPDQTAHATPTQRLAELFTEMGLAKRAADTADGFLRKMNAWTEPPLGSSTLLFLSYRVRAGGVPKPEYEKSRADSIERFRSRWQTAGRKLDEDFAWAAWWAAYGSEVATEDDAKAALAAMPKVRSKAIDSGRWQAIDLAMGRTYALAGSFADAVVPLKRAGSPCLTLTDPVSRTWATFYLGMAFEGTGDKDGAREAYRRVVDRWGKALPRSVTAEKAKGRLAVLGNKPK